MSVDKFERFLPWSGAVAGLCWIGQALLQKMTIRDEPGAATTQVIRDHLLLNYGSVACLVLMGMSLLFFATSVRNVLRSASPARRPTRASRTAAGWSSPPASRRW